MLGILPKFAPALKIPIDYAATTAQLYVRAIDQMDTAALVTGETAAVCLQRALDLTWPTIIAAMYEIENHLNISQCRFTERRAYQSEFSLVDECCLTEGHPTQCSRQFYTRDLSSSHAWALRDFREHSYADRRRSKLPWFEESEQRPVWATHGSVRRGDLLFKSRGRGYSSDFALVFRSGSYKRWPCKGCAWRPTSLGADETSANSRTIREYIVSSGLFLHAFLIELVGEVPCLIRAPSRLFTLTQAQGTKLVAN